MLTSIGFIVHFRNCFFYYCRIIKSLHRLVKIQKKAITKRAIFMSGSALAARSLRALLGWAPSSTGHVHVGLTNPREVWVMLLPSSCRGGDRPEGFGDLLRSSRLPGAELGFASGSPHFSRRSCSLTRVVSEVFLWRLDAPRSSQGPRATHSSLQRVEPPHLSLPPRLDRVEASSRRPCAVLPGPPTPHPYRPSCQYLLRSVGPSPEPKCRRAASRRERVTGASPSEKMRAVLLSLLREPGAILRLYVLRFQYLLKLKSFQDANTEERFPRIVVQVRAGPELAEARARGRQSHRHAGP